VIYEKLPLTGVLLLVSFTKENCLHFLYLLNYHAVAIHKLYFTIDFAIAIFMGPMIRVSLLEDMISTL
jgi:hypothetical protein